MNDYIHDKVVKWFYDHEELLIAIINKTPYQSDGWDYEIEVVNEFLTTEQRCYCGDIYTLGVIHRDDGPCHSSDHKEPEQEPNKDGSPCPEFWDWLQKAYNFKGDGNFTKYNMEVAFLAGKQAAQPKDPEQEPKCVAIVEVFGKGWRLDYMSLPVGKHKLYAQQYTYTTPPQRKPLTDEELFKLWDEDVSCDMPDTFTQFKHTARAIEAAHGIKGEA